MRVDPVVDVLRQAFVHLRAVSAQLEIDERRLSRAEGVHAQVEVGRRRLLVAGREKGAELAQIERVRHERGVHRAVDERHAAVEQDLLFAGDEAAMVDGRGAVEAQPAGRGGLPDVIVRREAQAIERRFGADEPIAVPQRACRARRARSGPSPEPEPLMCSSSRSRLPDASSENVLNDSPYHSTRLSLFARIDARSERRADAAADVNVAVDGGEAERILDADELGEARRLEIVRDQIEIDRAIRKAIACRRGRGSGPSDDKTQPLDVRRRIDAHARRVRERPRLAGRRDAERAQRQLGANRSRVATQVAAVEGERQRRASGAVAFDRQPQSLGVAAGVEREPVGDETRRRQPGDVDVRGSPKIDRTHVRLERVDACARHTQAACVHLRIERAAARR